MTPRCDDHEIEIEMRAAGALDAADSARLDGHLAGCADCRAYLSRKQLQDAALADGAVSEVNLDWSRIKGKLDRTVETYRRGIGGWLVGVPVMVLLALVVFEVDGIQVSPLWLVAAPVGWATFFTLVQRVRLAQLQALAAQRDVIGAWRSTCATNLRAWRWIRVLTPLSLLAFAIQMLSVGRPTLVITVNLVASTLVFVHGLRLARTARRELAELH